MHRSSGDELHRTSVDSHTNLPGIIHFNLPNTGEPLSPNQDYSWYLKVNCDAPVDNSETAIQNVTGYIRRVLIESDLEEALVDAEDDRQQAVIFAQHGIWFSALSSLANLISVEPNHLEDWKVFLNSVDLVDIASQPILECCES